MLAEQPLQRKELQRKAQKRLKHIVKWGKKSQKLQTSLLHVSQSF